VRTGAPGTHAANNIVALERYWARMGLRPIYQQRHIWYLEPSKFTRRFTKDEVAIAAAKTAKRQTGKKRAADALGQRQQHRTKVERTSSRAELAENRTRNRSLDVSEPQDFSKIISQKVPPLDGKLTPRMVYLLMQAAETGADVLRTDINSFKDGEPGLCYWGCEFFPKALRGGVFKAFVRGMIEIVDLIAAIFKLERLPTESAITRILSPWGSATSLSLGHEFGLRINRHTVSHFFSKGGRVEFVIQAIIEESMSLYDEQDGLEDSLSGWPEYHTLPSNELDGDFNAIRRALIPQIEAAGLQRS